MADGDWFRVGDRVKWPNGENRFGQPLGYHEGIVESTNEGVGGRCLKVKDERSGRTYYPHPNNVWMVLK